VNGDMAQVQVATGPDNAKVIAGYITSALKPPIVFASYSDMLIGRDPDRWNRDL